VGGLYRCSYMLNLSSEVKFSGSWSSRRTLYHLLKEVLKFHLSMLFGPADLLLLCIQLTEGDNGVTCKLVSSPVISWVRNEEECDDGGVSALYEKETLLLSCTWVAGSSFSIIRGCIPKFPDWVCNEIYAYNNKQSLRSNTKGYGGKPP